ncbi:TrmB family transcriptional regulator [Halapricum sp. CBA1109]|uniref:TrmB family transcriptional regulator n=1 Tax=Halapricum sp. CBA1109 TaxID=2668068 RepID=UPI0012FCF8E1|nr:TrmB family transcriptional regulator [Halapricum sp. CBA1109]MUV90871.1 TrmB family transcriptional regulator [Halapricum sp. CBA1109]
MDTAELIEVLEDAGLSPYQAEAYVTLLSLGPSSATDIADRSDVPDPRIYDVLRDLEKAGYVETYEQDSLHARAHDLDAVLEDLRGKADRLEAAAEAIEDRWEAPSMETNTVSFVTRLETILEQAEQYIGAAENQIQIAARLEEYERLRPALADAIDRDVHVRLALSIPDDAEIPTESELQAVATEVHYRELPFPFVLLVDREATCFAPHERSRNMYGVIVEDNTHAFVFNHYFMAGIWDVTTVLYEADSRDRVYVDIRKCIVELHETVDDGGTIPARIHGYDVETDDPITLSGSIVDYSYPELAEVDDEETTFYRGGEATLFFDTGDEVVEIGGWGAVIEDYEAERIVVDA